MHIAITYIDTHKHAHTHAHIRIHTHTYIFLTRNITKFHTRSMCILNTYLVSFLSYQNTNSKRMIDRNRIKQIQIKYFEKKDQQEKDSVKT